MTSKKGAEEPDIAVNGVEDINATIVNPTDVAEINTPFVEATVLADGITPTYAYDSSALQDSPINTTATYANVEKVPAVVQPIGQGSQIPEGARWITVKHIGGNTWSICAIISVLSCCITLLPCGLWAFLCPCDDIRAYEINGQVYDESGRPLGHISKLTVA